MAKVKVDELKIRDMFAMQAMGPLIEDAIARAKEKSIDPPERTGLDDHEWDDGPSTWAEGIATEAYIVADAMLASRTAKARKGRK